MWYRSQQHCRTSAMAAAGHLEFGNVNVTADTRKTIQMSFHMTAATWASHGMCKLLQRVAQPKGSHCLHVVVHRLPPGMHNRS
jgi:hypothetical protein